jgi:hypothetical protein
MKFFPIFLDFMLASKQVADIIQACKRQSQAAKRKRKGNEIMTTIATIENIVRQTEKAVQVDTGSFLCWVPKSIISIDDNGVIFAPIWFAKKNGISFYGQRSCVVG